MHFVLKVGHTTPQGVQFILHFDHQIPQRRERRFHRTNTFALVCALRLRFGSCWGCGLGCDLFCCSGPGCGGAGVAVVIAAGVAVAVGAAVEAGVAVVVARWGWCSGSGAGAAAEASWGCSCGWSWG